MNLELCMRGLAKIFFYVAVIAALLGCWCFFGTKRASRQESAVVPAALVERHSVDEKHHLIVFVHGTFGAMLSLLDAPGVMRDKVDGSLYARALQRMRTNEFFFVSRPMGHAGLTKFEPSFTRNGSFGFFAAYPIAQAFELVAQKTHLADEKRHYYLFGWNGLLSQSSRRVEAVRLLNQLSAEVKKFHDQGIEPKITLLCHSHGGNVALNMGLMVSMLRGQEVCTTRGVVREKSQKKLRLFLDFLPIQEKIQNQKGEKKWDYAPVNPAWNVTNVVLLATPIQPETDAAIFSSFFGAVYNCYSLGDSIQVSDWISTRRYFSERRFDRIQQLLAAQGEVLPKKLIQMRIMVGRKKTKDGKLARRALFYADPTHKDFWFLGYTWRSALHAFRPFPVLVLFPMLYEITQRTSCAADCDVNIARRSDGIFFEVTARNQRGIVAESILDHAFFDDLRQQAKAWSGNGGLLGPLLRWLHVI